MRRAVVLLSLVLLAPGLAAVSASNAPVVFLRDGLVVGVSGSAEATWTTSTIVQAGDTAFLSVACEACTTVLSLDGTELFAGTGSVTDVRPLEVAGSLNFELQFGTSETAEVSFLTSTLAASTQRPQPTDAPFTTLDVTGPGIDWWGGQLDRPRGDLGTAQRVIFQPSHDTDGYVLVNLSEPGWLDLVERAGDGRTVLDVRLHEGSSEVNLDVQWSEGDGMRWARLAVGLGQRVLVQASTAYPTATSAVDLVAHPAQGELRLLEDSNEGFLLVGHGGDRTVVDVRGSEVFTLTPITPTTLRVEHLVDGAWLQNAVFEISNSTTVWPLPNAVALRFTCGSPSCGAVGQVRDYGDVGSGHDAPNALDVTSNLVLNGTLVGFLPLNGSAEGHLVRAVHDVADVLPIHIDAWEDSVHLLSVTVHAPGGAVVVDLVPLDPTTGLIDEEARRTITMNEEDSISTQVGRGTHLLRLSVPDSNTTLAEPWGNALATLNYSVTITHVVIDEGEQPWFPPNETAQVWGERVRWILGFSLLIPAFGFALMQRKRVRLSKTIAMQRALLSRISSRLDAGREPKLERRDLRRALDAVAMLDFDEACSGWGTPEVSYRTSGIALACWRLDPRLAEHDGERLLIGLSNNGASWEVVALRLDAPLGEAVNIVSVEPRFHHRGEEVFLDTLGANSVTFLTVELERGPTYVDVEINGLVEGRPQASRATESLVLGVQEDE